MMLGLNGMKSIHTTSKPIVNDMPLHNTTAPSLIASTMCLDPVRRVLLFFLGFMRLFLSLYQCKTAFREEPKSNHPINLMHTQSSPLQSGKMLIARWGTGPQSTSATSWPSTTTQDSPRSDAHRQS